ncbi:MAG: crossover junction endodeoxyribonuclease RuvC [wastewater metagenome]|nr:crossover junction endodeoxyribonuclease RuvC [Candidatus Loosdrechtia aerotolerans]
MKILGIDPGTRVTGYGLIEKTGTKISIIDYGSIRADRDKDFSRRLMVIHEKIMEIIFRYKPDQMAIEEVFYGKNIKTAIRIGEGRGVIFLCAALANIPITEYAATVIKKAIVGNGSAHKDQVQEMVKIILNMSNTPESTDASDALAIAICHSHSMKA